MISIIVPVYNKEHFVGRTIMSILSQTYSDFELIIVDDGSTDNSLQVISSIKDDRIKVFHKINEGVSIARNYGVEKANGEYICFLDADDEWESNFLESMHNTICRYPNNSFFSCPFVKRKGQTDILCKIEGKGDSFIINDYCKTFCKNRQAICCVGSVCVRKSLLLQCGMFPSHVKKGEDHDLWLRLACHERIVYINTTRIIYNLDSENNSRVAYRSYKESFPYWKWYDYPYPYKRSLYLFTSYFILSNARIALKNKNYKSAWIMLSKIRLL